MQSDKLKIFLNHLENSFILPTNDLPETAPL